MLAGPPEGSAPGFCGRFDDADGKEPGSVCAFHPRPASPHDFRRSIERLAGLPLRPSTARLVLGDADDAPGAISAPTSSKTFSIKEIDPGWVLAQLSIGGAGDPLMVVAERPWWRTLSAAGSAALTRLWRHSVAVSQMAGKLGRDEGDSDSGRLARAGLLHGLGRWAVAAVDPDWLVPWFAEPDPRKRLELERVRLGVELTTLGRTLAERWQADPLVADAAWLHADLDGTLNGCASDPRRTGLLQRAFAWAERTPWSLFGVADREPGPTDPRLRVLIAEVQVRCGPAFIEPDATAHEEHWARSNARLRRQVADLRADQSSRDRFLNALAESDPSESPEDWAERAAQVWSREPGVAIARAFWTGPGAGPATTAPATDDPASLIVRLRDRDRPCAEIQLWAEDGARPLEPATHPARAPWEAWAGIVAERARLEARLTEAVSAHRQRVADEEPRLRQAKLDALAEFAAGAGHELNNPLAVIVGRAQLLMVRESDPGALRSLRAILGQAQRAHRILRDLIAVARPPEPRPRFCQPDDLVRSCLRDFKPDADARGVRLVAKTREHTPRVWADPDALRHLAEILLRNALEATPKGGTVEMRVDGDARSLSWTVKDDGRGISPTERRHLFDPFYCGRQAGRGLGLGLPRAVRIIALAGGELDCRSVPGEGTTFEIRLPLAAPPAPYSRVSGEDAIIPALRDSHSADH